MTEDVESTRQFETLAVEQAEAFRATVCDFHHPAKLDGFQRGDIGFFCVQAATVAGGDEYVLKNSHAQKGLRNLMRPDQTEPASL